MPLGIMFVWLSWYVGKGYTKKAIDKREVV
jgi:hypothetical protein